MHIEPGFVSPAKVMIANVAATGVLSYYSRKLLSKPFEIVKAVLAAMFFSGFMQMFHMNVGPSELHFIGAMAIYLTLGFIPTLFGFALGLVLQGLFFAPVDLPHLAVNSLSLVLPLAAVHYSIGKKLFDKSSGKTLDWKTILKMDAVFYGGVVSMVGFWLMISEVAVPFAAWASFASSYLVIVAVEPLVTYTFVTLLKSMEEKAVVANLSAVKDLTV